MIPIPILHRGSNSYCDSYSDPDSNRPPPPCLPWWSAAACGRPRPCSTLPGRTRSSRTAASPPLWLQPRCRTSPAPGSSPSCPPGSLGGHIINIGRGVGTIFIMWGHGGTGLLGRLMTWKCSGFEPQNPQYLQAACRHSCRKISSPLLRKCCHLVIPMGIMYGFKWVARCS